MTGKVNRAGSGIDNGTGSGIDNGIDNGIDSGIDSGIDNGIDSGIDNEIDGGIDNNELASGDAPRKRTRIQAQNEARIVRAALDVFSSNGYRGSTVEQIALHAGMSKANVLYYFKRKQDIYTAVLARTLTIWLNPLDELDPDGDPVEEVWKYAQRKLQLSREAPHASRLFANEILQGAPVIRPYLGNELKQLVDTKCQILQGWIDAGRLAPVSPLHLIFLIWSATQHYADFDPQIHALHEGSDDALFADAEHTLKLIITQGLRPAAA